MAENTRKVKVLSSNRIQTDKDGPEKPPVAVVGSISHVSQISELPFITRLIPYSCFPKKEKEERRSNGVIKGRSLT